METVTIRVVPRVSLVPQGEIFFMKCRTQGITIKWRRFRPERLTLDGGATKQRRFLAQAVEKWITVKP